MSFTVLGTRFVSPPPSRPTAYTPERVAKPTFGEAQRVETKRIRFPSGAKDDM